MTRHEFTMLVVDLLLAMESEGLRPFIDYVKRSDEEQRYLYAIGLSNCDGTEKISRHQRGRAVDLYFLKDDNTLMKGKESETLYGRWHDWWDAHGGEPRIEWDLGHFEVR